MPRRGDGPDRQVKVDDLEWSELVRTAPPGELDIGVALGLALGRIVEQRVKPGSRVGVAVGSRGIARVAEVVAAYPDEWARYVEGDDKLTGFFTGAVMKATSGKANGKEVAAELRRLRG